MDQAEAKKILRVLDKVPPVAQNEIKQATFKFVSEKLNQEERSVFMSMISEMQFWTPRLNVDDATELLLSLGMFVVVNG